MSWTGVASAPVLEKGGRYFEPKSLQKIACSFRREKIAHEIADEIPTHIEWLIRFLHHVLDIADSRKLTAQK